MPLLPFSWGVGGFVLSGELLCSWQAHFKGITRLKVTSLFCVSVAEDGVGKMWEMHKIVDQYYNGSASGNGKFTISPFRFAPHILNMQ
jgi:peroxiredoxin